MRARSGRELLDQLHALGAARRFADDLDVLEVAENAREKRARRTFVVGDDDAKLAHRSVAAADRRAYA